MFRGLIVIVLTALSLGAALALVLGVGMARLWWTEQPAATAPSPVAAGASPATAPAAAISPLAPPRVATGVELRGSAALLTGEVKAGPDGVIESWHNEHDSARWIFGVPAAGVYTIELTYARGVPGTDNIELTIGRQNLSVPVKSTGSWSEYRSFSVGQIYLAPGAGGLLLAPHGDLTPPLMSLKRIRLLPPGPGRRAFVQAARAFTPDDSGFIRQWLVLDPIKLDPSASSADPAMLKDMFDKSYWPTEMQDAPTDDQTVSIAGAAFHWRAQQANGPILDFLTLPSNLGKNLDNTLFLGVTYICCERYIPDVRLATGSDDDGLWFLNGEELTRVYANRGITIDSEVSPPVTLRAGVNTLRFEVINGASASAACARFLDHDGKPLTSYAIILAPPSQP